MKKTINECAVPSMGHTKGFVFALAYILLCFDAFGGALRYYFSIYNMDVLLYIPKLIALLSSIFLLFYFRRSPGIIVERPSVLWAYVLLFISVWVAIFNSVSYSSIAFMCLLLAPFILGLQIPVPEKDKRDTFILALGLIWFSTVIGVIADYYFVFPWKGEELELYGKVIEINRSWALSGIGLDRLAGFTRMSVVAAFYIGISGLILLVCYENVLLRVIIVLTTIAGLVMTTTKSAVLAFFIVLIMMCVRSLPFLRKSIFAFAVGVAIYLPLNTHNSVKSIHSSYAYSDVLFNSFEDRMVDTWPEFHSAIKHAIIGEGFGGVGTSNKMFGSPVADETLNVADSFPLYLMGWFGFTGGILIYICLGIYAYRMSTESNIWCQAIGTAGLFILLAGITTDVIESVPGGMLLGIIVRGISESKMIIKEEIS